MASLWHFFFVVVGWLWAFWQSYSIQGSILVSLSALYVATLLDGSEKKLEGNTWPWFAELSVWKKIAKYFPVSLHFEEEISPDKQYLFAVHPHGPFSINHALIFLTNSAGFHKYSPLEKRRDLGASVIFHIPLVREFCLWLGCVDASRSVATKVLGSKRSLLILVGGEQEQLLGKPGDHTVFIKGRKGFVRLAVQHNIPIVPVYVFGENELFGTIKYVLLFYFIRAIVLFVGILGGGGLL